MHFHITTCMSHSRKIDLTGRMGARSEINFTALPVDTADSSDEDIPLKALTLNHIRNKVDLLFDQDSLCLSTVNNLLSPSESEDDDEPEIISSPDEDDKVPPKVETHTSPPADAFTWPTTTASSAAGVEPEWVRTGPTPDGPAFTCAWPRFTGTPTIPRQRHQEARQYQPRHSQERENAHSYRRKQLSPRRKRLSSPLPPKPQASFRKHDKTPSRCIVKINFPQIGRSMNQILDSSLSIAHLLDACRTEWKLGPDALLELSYGHDKGCLPTTFISNYIPHGEDNPSMDFFLTLKGYTADVPKHSRDHAPSSSNAPRSHARLYVHAPSPRRTRDPPGLNHAARRAYHRSRDPYPSARREDDRTRPATESVPEVTPPSSKKSAPYPFPPTCPYGKASVPHASSVPLRPHVPSRRSPSVDSLYSLEVDEDVDMTDVNDDDDIDMDPKSGPVRTASEKRRYADEQRNQRDMLLAELNRTWHYIMSPPPPNAQFLTTEGFRPELRALLVKGMKFAKLATKIGCSAAAKAIRNDYKRRGRRYQAGADDFYDAIYRFNKQLL